MKKKEKIWGWIMVLPLTVGILSFVIVPLLYSLYVALSEYDLINQPVFTGLDNIKRLVADPYFFKSLGKAILNTIGVPLGMIFGLLAAVMFCKIKKGSNLFRTLFFMPIVCSSVAVTFMWKYLLDYNTGIINWILVKMGFERVMFFSEQNAMTTMIIIGVWSNIGIISILYYSALKNVSTSYYEASMIDGANGWQQFRYITLPMISPITFYILLTQLIGALQDYSRFMVMSGNGNSEAFTTTGVYVYKQTFTFDNPGYASTVAWALGLIIIGVTVVNFIVSKKWVSYEN